MFIHKQFAVNNIKVEEFPFKREISMAAYLIENEGVLSLDDDDLSEAYIIDGEISLSSKKRIDILVGYGEEYLAIVELKLGEINETAVKQLEEYLKGRQQLLGKYKKEINKNINGDRKWIGIIIGKTIATNVAKEIREGRNFQQDIPIAALTISRFKSDDGQVYIITDKYCPDKIKGKDYTKYRFNGEELSKNRLVLAVIRKYLQDNKPTSYEELINLFSEDLKRGWGVFREKKEAIKKQGEYKRYFINPEDLLSTSDGVTIAVCNQWGVGEKDSIKKFINYVTKKLGYDIREIKS